MEMERSCEIGMEIDRSMALDKPREECGVFGIYAPEGAEVAKDIYYGLLSLQHRGQEAAGIAVSDTHGKMGNICLKKGMGLVSEVFSADALGNMHGNLGVGHVRYSTTGGSVPENAQPISMSYIKGSLSLVHNGNLVNAASLKKEQMYRGQAHFTTSDSEVLAYEIISERLQTTSIEEAVKATAARIRGGYAVLVMSPRKLVAVRDPAGIKPLVLGTRGASYLLASESAAIAAVGGTVLRDIRPGEILAITENGIRSDQSLCGSKAAHCVFEYIYFARSDSAIDGISVREARFRAGEALARADSVERLAETNGSNLVCLCRDSVEGTAERCFCPDLVCGVPDSGLLAAEGYANASGLPLTFVFYKNSYIGRSFIKPTDAERQMAVHMKLSVHGSAVRGKRIVLIDDSIVRGTTMRQIVSMLRAVGAREVHVRISSPPFLYPCFYGTDVHSTKELIAAEHSTEEVRERIGADSLAYLKLEDFSAMTAGLPLCTACFSGNYPVG